MSVFIPVFFVISEREQIHQVSYFTIPEGKVFPFINHELFEPKSVWICLFTFIAWGSVGPSIVIQYPLMCERISNE